MVMATNFVVLLSNIQMSIRRGGLRPQTRKKFNMASRENIITVGCIVAGIGMGTIAAVVFGGPQMSNVDHMLARQEPIIAEYYSAECVEIRANPYHDQPYVIDPTDIEARKEEAIFRYWIATCSNALDRMIEWNYIAK
jgi:hypothetical protein